jgi:hypothetical protein
MKKLILMLILLGVITSCDKNDDDTTNEIVYNQEVTISNAEILNYNLGPFGDEQGASIALQAANYEISEIVRDDLGEKVYRYKAKSGFIGTDLVEIKRLEFKVASGKITEIHITRISITVTE